MCRLMHMGPQVRCYGIIYHVRQHICVLLHLLKGFNIRLGILPHEVRSQHTFKAVLQDSITS